MATTYMKFNPLNLALGLVLLFALVPGEVMAESAVTRHFSAYSENSTAEVDHAAWGQILGTYLAEGADGINRFNYAAVSGADRAALASYIEGLIARRPTELSRNEQIAYWANLYNALTVQVVLDHYPVGSIREIKFGRFFAIGPWGHDLVVVDGIDLNLMDIENRILRPLYDDPRIHYAINCASMGCPNLAATPYTGARLDAQMDTAARAYINHPRGVSVEDGRLRVSSIFVWFKGDFGGSDQGVIAHLRQFAEPELADDLDGLSHISGHGYNWELNEPADGS